MAKTKAYIADHDRYHVPYFACICAGPHYASWYSRIGVRWPENAYCWGCVLQYYSEVE